MTDINECSLGTHNCNANATCINTNGGFSCSCNSGFSGNGVSCSGIFFFFIICSSYFLIYWI